MRQALNRRAWGVRSKVAMLMPLPPAREQVRPTRTASSLAASQDEKQKSNRLECMYTNACSLGNKQEEMELIILSESYDTIGITETWWDNSYLWRIAMGGYRLFRKDRQGRRGGRAVLYIKENLECIEVNYSSCGSPIKCLWVKVRWVMSKGDLTVGICY